jgi:hypothetical protein
MRSKSERKLLVSTVLSASTLTSTSQATSNEGKDWLKSPLARIEEFLHVEVASEQDLESDHNTMS